MSSIKIEKTARIVGDYDVVVCGGGPAGFIAALAASKAGAKTCIIERFGFLGGLATSGYVAPISVFSYNGERTIGGLPWEFVERLKAMGGAKVEQPLNNVSFDFELYKLCAQRMLLESGVTLYMNSYISGCLKSDASNSINTVIIENKNGSEAIKGKVFIDCTGDADLASMAGAPMQVWEDHELQPVSMCFVLSGVDTNSQLLQGCMHHHVQGGRNQCAPVRNLLISKMEELNIPSFGGPWFCWIMHDGSVAVNMTRISANACDNRDFTSAECKLREDIFKLASVIKDSFVEFSHSYVSSIAAQAGARETRHIKGKHIITADEYLHAFKYPDSVSRSSHPVDIHSAQGEKQSIHFLENAAYVPYSALITDDFPNLIVAGRSLSADKIAFASLRVQATCMGMGQAAGFAGAMAAQKSVSVQDVDIKELIRVLRNEGAVF